MVDAVLVRVDDVDVVTGDELFLEHGEAVGRERVPHAEQHDELAFGDPDCLVERRLARISRADVAHAPVRLNQRGEHGRPHDVAPVIGDDQLPIRHRLVEDRPGTQRQRGVGPLGRVGDRRDERDAKARPACTGGTARRR